MKLQRLEFVGIGSFADRMEIDFTALGSAGMFLVEGPTGSGKSTILDAIVFALYGGVAGSGSDLGRLDSHLRDRQQEPYVELDFACGPDSYRIRRTPRHERDKRRGEGTMRDEGSVSLIQLTPAQAAISHKAKEVGDWVNEHVGLTKQQFVSTIVLAQGSSRRSSTPTRAPGPRFWRKCSARSSTSTSRISWPRCAGLPSSAVRMPCAQSRRCVIAASVSLAWRPTPTSQRQPDKCTPTCDRRRRS